jgi:hypothetical protein
MQLGEEGQRYLWITPTNMPLGMAKGHRAGPDYAALSLLMRTDEGLDGPSVSVTDLGPRELGRSPCDDPVVS